MDVREIPSNEEKLLAFDRVTSKVMIGITRMKGIFEVISREVKSLCDEAKTRVRVGYAYSEEFEVKTGVH